MPIEPGSVFEDIFPGNAVAFRKLGEALSAEHTIGFIGSGASAELYPTWIPLIHNLISTAQEEGLINASESAELNTLLDRDPLEVANFIEDAFGRETLRRKLTHIFPRNGQFTRIHSALVELPFKGFVTTNYDDGLESAFAKLNSVIPDITHSPNEFSLSSWRRGDCFKSGPTPILHWHGDASAPTEMVFTASDYDRFYGISKHTSFIENFWKSSTLLLVGYGFSDPFLTRGAETALRTLGDENVHFALVGVQTDIKISPLLRKSFGRKYRVNPIFYPIRIASDGIGQDHSALLSLIQMLKKPVGGQPTPQKADAAAGTSSGVAVGPSSGKEITTDTKSLQSQRDWERNLLHAPNGQQLYVDPPLTRQINGDAGETPAEEIIDKETLLYEKRSFLIIAKQESGSTTFAKRLVYDFQSKGWDAFYRDANSMPNYKKRLEADEAFNEKAAKNTAVVIDNIDIGQHERLLKEINGVYAGQKIIFITRNLSSDINTISECVSSLSIEVCQLDYLSRSHVRILARQIYNSGDDDLISSVVEKTYADLLDLCIPLAPSNVVMYLTVLFNEGMFSPLNRVSIMNKYIRELLKRPSDAYKESFNADDRLSVISSFVFYLHQNQKPFFSRLEWGAFCQRQMDEALISFDADGLLRDLLESRLIILSDGNYYFKYRLFYSFFLGSHVANRPALLVSFIGNGHHISVDGLIDVLCGLSEDNDLLVDDLNARLETAVNAFYGRFKLRDFDPYAHIEWRRNDVNEREMWESVSTKLDDGPMHADDVDRLKTSITAEKRTSDQRVDIFYLTDLERRISFNAKNLIVALRESRNLTGSVKIRSLRTIIEHYNIVSKIAFLFAPLIATRRYFLWNDTMFVNYVLEKSMAKQDPHERASYIAGLIPHSITSKAAEDVGSRKLSELVRHFILNEDLTGISQLIGFNLLLRSKPRGWEQLAEAEIAATSRTSLRLRFMLDICMSQFHQEVNTSIERSCLKRLVAIIEAKRSLKKDQPGGKAVSRVLARMEKRNYFSDAV